MCPNKKMCSFKKKIWNHGTNTHTLYTHPNPHNIRWIFNTHIYCSQCTLGTPSLLFQNKCLHAGFFVVVVVWNEYGVFGEYMCYYFQIATNVYNETKRAHKLFGCVTQKTRSRIKVMCNVNVKPLTRQDRPFCHNITITIPGSYKIIRISILIQQHIPQKKPPKKKKHLQQNRIWCSHHINDPQREYKH